MVPLSRFILTIFILQCIPDSLCVKPNNPVRNIEIESGKTIEVPLVKINNNYYGDITVGTALPNKKDQVFRVNFDTGSKYLWLITTEACPKGNCQKVGYTPYDKTKSKTFSSKAKTPFKLEYTDGTVVTGHLGWDNLKIGKGKNAVQIYQTIGFASSVKGIFEDCDGIFGLGMLSEALFPGNPLPPMWTLNKKYKIGEFGMYLSRKLNGDNAGKLTFGGHDPTLIEGPLQWHAVQPVKGKFEGYKIKFDKIILQKGKDKVEFKTDKMLALPDSGNNVIVGPEVLFNNIKTKIMKHATFTFSKSYTFRCSENIKVLPNVIFVMDGRNYVMEPKDYIWTLKSGTLCKLGMFGMKTDHIVLGQIFMQAFYTKFNIDKQKVGFARARHPKN